MKVLVIGGGGREHALVWRLAQSPGVEQVYCAPGNAGVAMDASCIPIDLSSVAEAANVAETLAADLTIIGPEAPLVAGIADAFEARNLPLLGPSQYTAQLEGSKVFAKEFMREHQIPTAGFTTIESPSEIDDRVGKFGYPVALKADGLAAGKGVVVVRDESEARETAAAMLAGELVGSAGRRILVEEFLSGEEVSFIALSDGERCFVFPPTQDHKPAFDNDEGPNTGGMGAYCAPALLSDRSHDFVLNRVVHPVLDGMRAKGHPFRGFLYCGLMMTAEGPKVLEFNVRMGDPETQSLMYRIRGDLLQLFSSCAAGNLNADTVHWDPGPSACVVLASNGYPGKYPIGLEISGLSEANQSGAQVFHAGTRFLNGTIATAGGRVLGVTASGSDLAAALENTYQAVDKIRFDGMHYRRDIGSKGLKHDR